jgi:single-stranded-DNA-specific exonuclease
MKSFVSAVVGVTFEGRQEAVRRCVEGQPVRVEHDRDNQYDRNAVAVLSADGRQLGFLPSALGGKLVAQYGAGLTLDATVAQVLPHRDSWGLRVKIVMSDSPDEQEYVQHELGAWSLDEAPLAR